jgi:hypothetical protein
VSKGVQRNPRSAIRDPRSNGQPSKLSKIKRSRPKKARARPETTNHDQRLASLHLFPAGFKCHFAENAENADFFRGVGSAGVGGQTAARLNAQGKSLKVKKAIGRLPLAGKQEFVCRNVKNSDMEHVQTRPNTRFFGHPDLSKTLNYFRCRKFKTY